MIQMDGKSYKNVSGHPWHLDDGRSVAAGDSVVLEKPGPGDRQAIDAGMLVEQSGPTKGAAQVAERGAAAAQTQREDG